MTETLAPRERLFRRVGLPARFLAGMMSLIISGCSVVSHLQEPAFRVLVVASGDPDHAPMSAAAEPFLAHLAAENHFALDFTRDVSRISEANLARYQVFVQLHLAPFNMSGAQQQALQKFIEAVPQRKATYGAVLDQTGKIYADMASRAQYELVRLLEVGS